jgi:hypothetical protein
MQRLIFLQSMWAMQRRHATLPERTMEESIEMIVDAGYDGISMSLTDAVDFRRAAGLIKPHHFALEAQCFPTTIDGLKPALELAAECGADYVNIQPDVRPRRLQDSIALIEGWRRLADEAPFPVYIETHRNRLTTDLYFTLDLLDCFPDLVGREFAWPVSAENHGFIHRVLDHAWAFHGRVASREQVQVEVSFPQHRMWLELFLNWWSYGFRSWRQRAAPNAALAFVCELGPQPYAISGPDGNDLSDRWADALLLRSAVRQRWEALDS